MARGRAPGEARDSLTSRLEWRPSTSGGERSRWWARRAAMTVRSRRRPEPSPQGRRQPAAYMERQTAPARAPPAAWSAIVEEARRARPLCSPARRSAVQTRLAPARAPERTAQRWQAGHQYVVRLSSPWPCERMRAGGAAARARRAGPAVDLRGTRSWRPLRADCCMSGRTPRTTASASSSLTSRQPAATGRRRPASSPRTSRSCRCRRRCAGPAGRRRACAWGRPRAGGAGSAPRRTVARRRGRGRARARRGSLRTRAAVMSSSTGPLNWTTSSSPCRSTSHAERGERGQRSPRRSTRHAPVMRRCEWIDEAALEAQQQVLAGGVGGLERGARRGARASGRGRSAGAA